MAARAKFFDGLATLMGKAPSVANVEAAGILPRAAFYSQVVPDSTEGRQSWNRGLDFIIREERPDLVFFDPDNGIEVSSKPVGHKDSSKYVTWKELKSTWNTGASLVVYQHFIREEREGFIERLTQRLKEETSATAEVHYLRTPHVVFLLAAQPHHAAKLSAAISSIDI